MSADRDKADIVLVPTDVSANDPKRPICMLRIRQTEPYAPAFMWSAGANAKIGVTSSLVSATTVNNR